MDNQTPIPPNEAMFRALIYWGEENSAQIREAHLSKGGWEGWMQEEMRFLYNAGREDNCYENSEKMAADIVLSPGTSGEDVFPNEPYVGEECAIIELKCESYHNAHKFKGEVKKDMNKVNGGIFKTRLFQGGCNIYCIALAMTNEGACDMEDLGLELYEFDDAKAPFQIWWSVRMIDADEYTDEEDEEIDDFEDDDTLNDDENDGANDGTFGYPGNNNGYNYQYGTYY
ncbi:uncharacterized protein LDX57_000065 [Aspergillus melleus]|uniref:uncharacterized protein n=1 Tax=Aspergillus melleus TaxID=138277 RepID=UPI001E8E292A|nr:uncharacterized protein LDX57_000065 [Aspergillus melleus]KAH8422307.1 hypothetical protein LDX57_000065 [Aspergillus melleus]